MKMNVTSDKENNIEENLHCLETDGAGDEAEVAHGSDCLMSPAKLITHFVYICVTGTGVR